MEPGVILLTLSAYALAGYLWWNEHTPNYTIGLVAGHTVSLLSPLWQRLYGFSYSNELPALYHLFGYALPRAAFLAAWLMILPPLLVLYLYRQRWWSANYLTCMLTFFLFVLYHVLIELLGQRADWWYYDQMGALPFGVAPTLLASLMNGLISFGLLAAVLLTRHYSWSSLLLFLLPVPLLINIFIYGVLGAPMYTVLLLDSPIWVGRIGMVGTLGLMAWIAHIIASSLEQRRDWH